MQGGCRALLPCATGGAWEGKVDWASIKSTSIGKEGVGMTPRLVSLSVGGGANGPIATSLPFASLSLNEGPPNCCCGPPFLRLHRWRVAPTKTKRGGGCQNSTTHEEGGTNNGGGTVQ